MSRVERKRMQKTASILEATNLVLKEKGYDGISLEEVAERVDLTKASLYHYFDSKEELLIACLQMVAEDARTRMSRVLEEHGEDPAGIKLEKLICEHLVIVVKDHPQVAELFTRRLLWPRPYQEQVKTMRGEHDRMFRDVIEEGIASGEFTCSQPDLARRIIHGAVNLVPVWLTERSEDRIRDLGRRLTAEVLMILKHPDAPTS